MSGDNDDTVERWRGGARGRQEWKEGRGTYSMSDGRQLGYHQETQVASHEGFRAESVQSRYASMPGLAETPPTKILARPPAWTEVAGRPCAPGPELTTSEALAHMDRWDVGPGSANDGKARGLCAGCPVVEQCLKAALEEEGDTHVKHRFLVRGGVTPRARAKMAKALGLASRPAPQCRNGHDREGNAYRSKSGKLRCRRCEASTRTREGVAA